MLFEEVNWCENNWVHFKGHGRPLTQKNGRKKYIQRLKTSFFGNTNGDGSRHLRLPSLIATHPCFLATKYYLNRTESYQKRFSAAPKNHSTWRPSPSYRFRFPPTPVFSVYGLGRGYQSRKSICVVSWLIRVLLSVTAHFVLTATRVPFWVDTHFGRIGNAIIGDT